MMATAWAREHRRSLLCLCAFLVIGGLIAGSNLPVALFPQISFPRIVVSVEAGDRPAAQMMVLVTRPLEERIRALPGVRGLRSTTSRGSAEVSVNFAWGTDMRATLQQVTGQLAQLLPTLPAGTQYSARRMDTTVFPVAAYSLTATTLDQVRLHDAANFILVPALSTIEGVAAVTIQGGAEAEYRVTVDPDKLFAFNLALDEVVQAVGKAAVLKAVGRIEDHYKLFLLMADATPADLAALRELAIKSGPSGLVRLKDIAAVTIETVPQWLKVTADGKSAVSLQIYQQPGGNTVAIVAEVAKRLTALQSQLPAGLKIGNWYDQSQLIVAATRSMRDAILIGVVLAGGVLLFFLRDVRITLLVVLMVPAVLAATVLCLFVLGMGFDIMTLGGMAAAVGLVVDDAIVMIEHIVQRLESRGRRVSISDAAHEFTRPLAASSLATIVIFLPLAFLDGVTGAFFKALSATMASALVVSFLTAWLIVPVLIGLALRERRPQAARSRLREIYARALAAILRRPWLLALWIVPLLVGGGLASQQVGSGFLPPMDEGGFVLDYRAAPGTSLAETDRLLKQVETLLAAIPEVANYARRTGAQLGGGITEANEGDYFIRLRAQPRRPIEEVMDAVRQRVLAQVPGLDIDLLQLMEDVVGDLTAVPQPIEIKLYGPDSARLQAIAPLVAAAITSVPGVVDVRNGVTIAGDALDIHVDPTRAVIEGLDVTAVTNQIEGYFTGIVAAQVQRGPKLLGIRVWLPAAARATDDQLRELSLRAPDGHRFPLARVATVRRVAGQAQITRENLQPMVAVTARVSGRDMGSAVRDVRARLAASAVIPPDIRVELGGLYHEQQVAFRGLTKVFVAAVALVFVLLLYLYERFTVAIAIALMPLLAIAGVFIGLWVTATELNITAMMGMTMVVGIITECAIFYFSAAHLGIARGASVGAALLRAGMQRVRPITMTTLAAILALLPLALGIGEGAAMQQPLAIAIIAGLILQLPLVLLALPGLYLVSRPR